MKSPEERIAEIGVVEMRAAIRDHVRRDVCQFRVQRQQSQTVDYEHLPILRDEFEAQTNPDGRLVFTYASGGPTYVKQRIIAYRRGTPLSAYLRSNEATE